MIVNILFFSVGTVFSSRIIDKFGAGAGAAFAVISVLIVILLGEVTPKTIANASSYHFSRLFAIPVFLLHRLLLPIRLFLQKILQASERIAGVAVDKENPDEELKLLFEMGQSSGIISRSENELLAAVIDLPVIKAGEIMTPRVDLISIREDEPTSRLLEIAKEYGHSKVPVRSKDNDELIGWIDAREAFIEPYKELKEFILPGLLISEFDNLDQVLDRFLAHNSWLAIVVDERGASAGILVLTDIISELFGEFGDEDAPPAQIVTKDGKDTYIIHGQLSIREWCHIFNINAQFPGVSTVGGLTTALLGRPAKKGDVVDYAGINIEVLKTEKRRIAKLRVSKGDDRC